MSIHRDDQGNVLEVGDYVGGYLCTGKILWLHESKNRGLVAWNQKVKKPNTWLGLTYKIEIEDLI